MVKRPVGSPAYTSGILVEDSRTETDGEIDEQYMYCLKCDEQYPCTVRHDGLVELSHAKPTEMTGMGNENDCFRNCSLKGIQLSNWIIVEGHAATRVIEGSDPNKVENRIAFIEERAKLFY